MEELPRPREGRKKLGTTPVLLTLGLTPPALPPSQHPILPPLSWEYLNLKKGMWGSDRGLRYRIYKELLYIYIGKNKKPQISKYISKRLRAATSHRWVSKWPRSMKRSLTSLAIKETEVKTICHSRNEKDRKYQVLVRMWSSGNPRTLLGKE